MYNLPDVILFACVSNNYALNAMGVWSEDGTLNDAPHLPVWRRIDPLSPSPTDFMQAYLKPLHDSIANIAGDEMTIIVGHYGWRLIPKNVFAKRRTIVITSDGHLEGDVEKASSFENALLMCNNAEAVAVVGGLRTYRAAMPYATGLDLVKMECPSSGEKYFPFDPLEWRLVRADRGFSKGMEYIHSLHEKISSSERILHKKVA